MLDFHTKRPARVMGITLAAALLFGTSAWAADSGLTEGESGVVGVSQSDAPVVVSTAITKTSLGVGTVTVAGVNVRVNPSEDADIVTTAAEGQELLVLSQEGDWYRVAYANLNGFIKSDYLSVEESSSTDYGYAMIRVEGATLRTSNTEDSEAITSLTTSDAVEITGVENGWYKVVSDGTEGYIRSDLVDPTAPVPAEKIYDYAVVSYQALNMRTAPDATAEIADVLFSGSLAELVEQNGDWYEITYGDETGYVNAAYVTATNDETAGSTEVETANDIAEREAAEAAAAAQAAAQAEAAERAAAQAAAAKAAAEAAAAQAAAPSYESSSSSSSGYTQSSSGSSSSSSSVSYSASSSSSIVSVAQQYLGVPYVWGGTSPSGFDCSGFVQYVFKQCGYSLSRTADAQYYNGTAISYSQLQPGDLVFFAGTYSTSGISHVGIYIGGGQMIHAGGGAVKISDITSGYYANHYYAACRIA